jgi:hypothetical protein
MLTLDQLGSSHVKIYSAPEKRDPFVFHLLPIYNSDWRFVSVVSHNVRVVHVLIEIGNFNRSSRILLVNFNLFLTEAEILSMLDVLVQIMAISDQLKVIKSITTRICIHRLSLGVSKDA